MTDLFPTHVYAERLTRAAELCREQGLSGLIIGTGPELAYLTGSWISSHERLTALVIPAHGHPVLLAPQTDIGDLALSALPHLDVIVRGWVDGEDAHARAVAVLDPGPVALGSSLTTLHVLRLQELIDAPVLPAATTLKELFMRKDAAEIEQLALAGAAIDRVHERVPSLLRAGRTENQVAADLRTLILKEHAVVDFVIVGSGPNGANPHHSHSARVLEEGDVVVVDVGGTRGPGYHSDSTRTYIVGGAEHAPTDAAAAYEVLQQAHAAAMAQARPGVTAASVDAAAREVITQAGFGGYFIHRTGHGIGLSTHEEPYIMAGNELVLEEGMCFSIEPGIYLPGQWGMRLEDIVVVSPTGVESLSHQQRDLR
ncbi:MAG: Xaa-Pro peptidase family protein [Corynebacterium sp.]|uniref:M24 family metallopeptidase n=1 Tax=Corynebacterium sp. TaxID=1720 RepID=UPI0026DFA1E1|nr:Xaa-Pro peptidase family protein [Corynebacterium sp.]MDO5669689.1 Xaa-Pro peptidase family protein [Corynebacterium sp.]